VAGRPNKHKRTHAHKTVRRLYSTKNLTWPYSAYLFTRWVLRVSWSCWRGRILAQSHFDRTSIWVSVVGEEGQIFFGTERRFDERGKIGATGPTDRAWYDPHHYPHHHPWTQRPFLAAAAGSRRLSTEQMWIVASSASSE
jgi:hypothetical protein